MEINADDLARLYLELRDLKERINKLEGERVMDSKPILDGVPRNIRNFINARNKLEGDKNE